MNLVHLVYKIIINENKIKIEIFFLILFTLFLLNCSTDNKIKNLKKYDGPLIIATDVHTLFSDSALLKVELKAPLQYEYENGDRVFPKGVVIYFLEKDGRVSNSLKANHGKFYKSTGIYTATGNVIIKDTIAHKKMNTEKLHWNPAKKKVYTEKFVRIETQNEILTGNGLDATQDFSYYKILKPTGVFSINQ